MFDILNSIAPHRSPSRIAVFAGPVLAAAAGLTDDDSRFLDSAYGPAVRHDIVDRMTADALDKLHEVVNDPFCRRSPSPRSRSRHWSPISGA